MTTCMFPGQGSQKKGMGASLFKKFPQKVHQADAILGYSIEELCLIDSQNRLHNTEYTQPALYVIETLSFLEYLDSNPDPSYCIGHSLGEYAALFAAEVFDFETGLILVKKRGELMAQHAVGTMLAVIHMPIERIMAQLRHHQLDSIDCVNLNAPNQIILAGPEADIAVAKNVLSAEAKTCILLPITGAFHSRYMRKAAHEFSKFIEPYNFNTPQYTVIANVNAAPYNAENMKNNLIRQIDHPVRWTEIIHYLQQRGETEFKEIGPGTVLTRLFRYFL